MREEINKDTVICPNMTVEDLIWETVILAMPNDPTPDHVKYALDSLLGNRIKYTREIVKEYMNEIVEMAKKECE